MKKIITLLLLGAACLPVPAAQLLETGSFEFPPVSKPKTVAEGGDVVRFSVAPEWVKIQDEANVKDGGKIILGLTNETSRTGRQALSVDFSKVTRENASAQLASNLIPILPNQPYHFAIWGRVDAKRPLTKDQRLPYLKLRIDWFRNDESQTGEVEWHIQPMPGSLNRPPLFVSGRWSEYFADGTSPLDAAFVKITWFWETTVDKGETDGVIYFDDSVIVGEAPAKPTEEEMAEADSEESSEPAPVPLSSPAERPAPKK